MPIVVTGNKYFNNAGADALLASAEHTQPMKKKKSCTTLLTTTGGNRVADNQNSLIAGPSPVW